MGLFRILKLYAAWVAVLGIATTSLSCSFKADFTDLSIVDIFFTSPAENYFTNQTQFDFKVAFNSNNPALTAENAFMEIYEGEDCNPESKILTRRLNRTDLGVSSNHLEDGKLYSARVFVHYRDRVFRSVCSPWLGVDTQSPNPVAVEHPASDTYVSSKQVFAAWTSTSDNGIAGLRDEPYRLRLYGQPACGGDVLQVADSKVEQHIFENLTHGVTYSVQVSAVDKAGNESPLSCSPYTEIDIFAPGFRLEDSSSIPGYSRVSSPQIIIENDSQAGYWCITPDLDFFPDSASDPCPGGTGPVDGWYTTRPSTLPLTSGDGLKTYHLWLFRSNGSLLSNKKTAAAIRLDQTPPGTFNVIGVGNSVDQVFDNWLTSLEAVTVRWTPSSDATDYTVEIKDGNGNLICRKAEIAGSESEFTFENGVCSPLLNDGTYTIHMTSFDVARNPTTTTFNFTVDLVPPEDFSIQGIAGGLDLTVDGFFGLGQPVIHFENASGATHYEIEVKGANDSQACTLGSKPAPTTVFNYATELGMTCSFSHGETYRAYVTALDDGKSRTPALNSPFEFVVDAEAPTLNITSGPLAVTTAQSATIEFEVDDAISGVRDLFCSLDGAPNTPCSSPITYNSLSEGAHQVSVTAIDQAGNSVTKTHSWEIDLTGPNTIIASGPTGWQSSNSATFTFSATDVGSAGVGHFECSFAGSAFAPCMSPVTYTAISEGAHTFSVRAVDTLGNTGPTISRNFSTDYTAPTLTISSGPANPTHNTNSASVSFMFSEAGSGIASIECRLNSGAFTACTSPVNYTGLSAGNHTVTVRVTDNTGHATTATHSWTLYSYSWTTGGWSACSAPQPTWSTGGWGACTAAQPAYSYGAWGACSASCGGGVRYRTQTCPVVNGTQTRSVNCPTTTGTQSRSVTCLRNDGTSVAESYCLAAKPASSQSCSRNDCAGAAPTSTQTCSRGGGSDCHSAQPTSQSCNTQACCNGLSLGGYCWYKGGNGQNCVDACASRGGVVIGGIRNWAGSHGSLANCQALFNAFGYSDTVKDANSCTQAMGCAFAGLAVVRCTNIETNATGIGNSLTWRFCSCAY